MIKEDDMPNSKTWILITDVVSARIFAMHKAKFQREPKRDNIEFIGEFMHEKSRERNRELVTDRQGLYGGGTFEQKILPKTHEAEMFAVELLKHLESARNGEKFRDLIIIAPSHFMGMLNKHMSTELNQLVIKRIEKDYTHFNESELIPILVEHF